MYAYSRIPTHIRVRTHIHKRKRAHTFILTNFACIYASTYMPFEIHTKAFDYIHTNIIMKRMPWSKFMFVFFS